MRISNNLFLARANLKGSKKKNTVMVMMILSVISITLLVGFLGVANNICEGKTNYKYCRQVYVFPKSEYEEDGKVGVTEKTKNAILETEHVVSCEKVVLPTTLQYLTVNKITDENGEDISNTTAETNLKKINESIGYQYHDDDLVDKVIKGKGLDETPVMSCILPNKYTYEEYDDKAGEFTGYKEEIDTESLLGKTLDVEYEYSIHAYKKQGDGYAEDWLTLPKIKYRLKVVGIYYFSPLSSAEETPCVTVSKETAEKIDKMAIDNALKNGMKEELNDYLNDEYARDYVVTADSIDNINEVMTTLQEKGIGAYLTVGSPDESMLTFTAVFGGVGTFLTVAILLLTIINIFLSVHNNIAERKAEIGLMKAVGYKTGQIFYSMYLENIILAVKALLIGGALSAVMVFIINLINKSGDELQMLYVMPWLSFLILLAIAFGVILVIPLVCLLIMVYNIAKIQPQEAMNA
ncbi:MAG: ABC transporter permease [Acutalibacteraceae bacterium]|nr:ABC transporter permease [Acutalibacteraceae bacterium]